VVLEALVKVSVRSLQVQLRHTMAEGLRVSNRTL
jgi:Fe2+ transport system protein FeoA